MSIDEQKALDKIERGEKRRAGIEILPFQPFFKEVKLRIDTILFDLPDSSFARKEPFLEFKYNGKKLKTEP